LRARGFERCDLTTQLGVVTVRRRYYTCPQAGHGGWAPFDQLLSVVHRCSTGMQRWIQYAGAQCSFEESAETIAEFSGVAVAPSTVRAVTVRHGLRRDEAQAEQMRALDERRLPEPATAPQRIYIEMDGATVLARTEKKECKVGVVFHTTAAKPLRPKRVRYVAGIETAAVFGKRLFTAAWNYGVMKAQEVVALGDGAPWIWDLVALYYPQATQILDFFHGCEHLREISRLRWPDEGNPVADRWVRAQQARLKRGWWDAFMLAFDEIPFAGDERAKLLGYFESNRCRMQYRDYRARRLFIGSGMAESGCKQVVIRRMRITGARWNPPSAHALVQIRVAYLNGDLSLSTYFPLAA